MRVQPGSSRSRAQIRGAETSVQPRTGRSRAVQWLVNSSNEKRFGARRRQGLDSPLTVERLVGILRSSRLYQQPVHGSKPKKQGGSVNTKCAVRRKKGKVRVAGVGLVEAGSVAAAGGGGLALLEATPAGASTFSCWPGVQGAGEICIGIYGAAGHDGRYVSKFVGQIVSGIFSGSGHLEIRGPTQNPNGNTYFDYNYPSTGSDALANGLYYSFHPNREQSSGQYCVRLWQDQGKGYKQLGGSACANVHD